MSSNLDTCLSHPWNFFVRDKLLYQYQLTTTASAIHPEIAIQPALKEHL